MSPPGSQGSGGDDASVSQWFLTADERRNSASDIRAWTTGNRVEPLVDGASYFARLHEALTAAGPEDQIYLVDFRGDTDERLDGEGSEVGTVLARVAASGTKVFGLIWRSQPGWLDQSEGANAELVRTVSDSGGEVLLDSRTRRAGSHHQKYVVIRHPNQPARDVAFVGGIDLGLSRRDDHDHRGDPQVMDFPKVYGPRPPWHDVQAAIRGPAVGDIEHSFRERWYGSTVLDLSSPLRMLIDRAYHAGKLVGRDLPDRLPDPPATGTQAVQVLRTYPARLRRYPFAPLGERSIAHAYRKVFSRAQRLIYIEDQYLWAPFVADLLADELRRKPELHLIAVVPRYPDKEGASRWPSLVGREQAIKVCRLAGKDRFAIYDVENTSGTPVYVHAKVVVIDDVWAMIGSDNLNRRSWTHDSELSCAVLDSERDPRQPLDPAGQGDGARVFARDLRLGLWREHLDRAAGDPLDDIVDLEQAFKAMRSSAEALQDWYDHGRKGPRPPGRLRPHVPERLSRLHRLWAVPVYRGVYDPDGRAVRDRVRHRP
ncbi:phospholipase D family protein [Jatrophihabitans telluris]|uniref:Phospholipase D family protein n=1 Tax=Jatrophihabitans telluris TaxID=2038343 RepID=A0ABY4QZC0_9ACTN|nr:phospholipase D family protein [Jatrophihabitans telluris]UQX89021.1 phospholipase D family protein [Jatrophihabitans telluris]